MAYIKIEIDTKILTVAEWGMFKPAHDMTYPRAYRISDGAMVIFWNSVQAPNWLDSRVVSAISIQEDFVTGTFEPAPNAGISGHTLLWAIALAQDPTLIRTMDK